MDKTSLFTIFLLLLLLSSSSGGTVKLVKGDQETWCVAKPSTSDRKLQSNIDYACGYVDCSVIKSPHGNCSKPATLMSTASVVMNLYYQSQGRNPWDCDFKGSALVAIKDPSFGNCNYVSNSQ